MIDLRRHSKNDLWAKTSVISINDVDECSFRPFSFFRYAKIVKGDQISFYGFNIAEKVEKDQVLFFGLNIADIIGRDQELLFGYNCAGTVMGNQEQPLLGANFGNIKGMLIDFNENLKEHHYHVDEWRGMILSSNSLKPQSQSYVIDLLNSVVNIPKERGRDKK